MLLRLAKLRVAGHNACVVDWRDPVPAIAGIHCLSDAGKTGQLDLDAEFFKDFPPGGILSPLAEVDLAAGQSPGAGFGLFQALDQKEATLLVQNGRAAPRFDRF